ncbi:hypothetical protein KW792_01030 [Candidatus Saccharibacteria bacterium]|nr:hypothetical protein [Candidatus Saccharibacteria bacterium]
MDDGKSSWEYKPEGTISENLPEDDGMADEPTASHSKAVSWEAAEYIEHHHGASWYLLLVVFTAALAALVYLISSGDLIATGIVAVLGVIVGIFASQKPGIAKYEIGDSGLSVNGKLYKYGNYKSFSIINEGELSSANLLPLKRFAPPLAAYFSPADEKKVTKALGDKLPYEESKLDGIDRLTRRLRL